MKNQQMLAILGLLLTISPAWADPLFKVVCNQPCVAPASRVTCVLHVGVYAYGPQVLELDAATAVVHHASRDESLAVPNVSLYQTVYLLEPIPIVVKPGETAQYPEQFSPDPDDQLIRATFTIAGNELYLSPPAPGVRCITLTIPGTGLTQCRYPEPFALQADVVLPVTEVCPTSGPVTPTTLPLPIGGTSAGRGGRNGCGPQNPGCHKH